MSFSRIIRDREFEPMAWPRVACAEDPPPDGEAHVDVAQAEEPPAVPPPDPTACLREELESVRAEAAKFRDEISHREEAARRKVAETAEAAFAEGVQSGQANAAAQAKTEARQEYEDALRRTCESIRDVLEARRTMRKQMEEDLVQLAIAVARRILHRELHVDPEALVGIVKAVVGRVESREIHRVLVAPYDLPFLQKHFASLGLPARVELAADGALVRGSVILETARGQLDASVETQLSEIERGFADLVRRS